MKFEIKQVGSQGHFAVYGSIDERSDFSKLFAQTSGLCLLDLGDVSSMNSKGVKQWVEFVKAASDFKLRLTRVPAFLVLYANQIRGFLPANVEIESFYVPFFAPTSDVHESLLFVYGVHFDAKAVYLPAVVRSEVTGEVLEVDVRPESYFGFLGPRQIISK